MRTFYKFYGLKAVLRVLYLKWIKGHCHHLCCFCGYQSDCLSGILDEQEFSK
jgi:hypothetical protein